MLKCVYNVANVRLHRDVRSAGSNNVTLYYLSTVEISSATFVNDTAIGRPCDFRSALKKCVARQSVVC